MSSFILARDIERLDQVTGDDSAGIIRADPKTPYLRHKIQVCGLEAPGRGSGQGRATCPTFGSVDVEKGDV
jgi:hypothetical protein